MTVYIAPKFVRLRISYIHLCSKTSAISLLDFQGGSEPDPYKIIVMKIIKVLAHSGDRIVRCPPQTGYSQYLPFASYWSFTERRRKMPIPTTTRLLSASAHPTLIDFSPAYPWAQGPAWWSEQWALPATRPAWNRVKPANFNLRT